MAPTVPALYPPSYFTGRLVVSAPGALMASLTLTLQFCPAASKDLGCYRLACIVKDERVSGVCDEVSITLSSHREVIHLAKELC